MIRLNPTKLFENLKSATAKEYTHPYTKIENHETYRQIIFMIENEDIDFNKFTEEDVLNLLDIYYAEEEDVIEHGIAESVFIIDKFKQMPPKKKDTKNVFI